MPLSLAGNAGPVRYCQPWAASYPCDLIRDRHVLDCGRVFVRRERGVTLLVIDRWKIQTGITLLLTDRCTPGSYARAGPDATERYVPVCFVCWAARLASNLAIHSSSAPVAVVRLDITEVRGIEFSTARPVVAHKRVRILEENPGAKVARGSHRSRLFRSRHLCLAGTGSNRWSDRKGRASHPTRATTTRWKVRQQRRARARATSRATAGGRDDQADDPVGHHDRGPNR